MYYLVEYFMLCYLELKHNGLFHGKFCRPMFLPQGTFDIGLKEPDWDPNENDGKNMYPGYTV